VFRRLRLAFVWIVASLFFVSVPIVCRLAWREGFGLLSVLKVSWGPYCLDSVRIVREHGVVVFLLPLIDQLDCSICVADFLKAIGRTLLAFLGSYICKHFIPSVRDVEVWRRHSKDNVIFTD
jgi:hypothetical protein